MNTTSQSNIDILAAAFANYNEAGRIAHEAALAFDAASPADRDAAFEAYRVAVAKRGAAFYAFHEARCVASTR